MTDDLFDDEDESTETQRQDNASQAQARLDREKAKLKKELDELKAWKAEREQADHQRNINATFAEIGLNPKWSGFYQGEDATPEAVKAWALENDFIQTDAEEEAPAPRGPERQHGFTPTVIEGGAVPAGKTYSRQEMEEIARDDPARAQKLYEAGKVKLNNPIERR